MVGKASNPHMKAGQILGCDVTSAVSVENLVDSFVIVGAGLFHSLGVGLKVTKKCWLLDVEKREVVDVDPYVKRTLSLIAERIDRARRARRFGVIIGLKDGQTRVHLAEEIAERLKRAGKEVIKVAVREVTEERLSYYPEVEAFIQTACPRISIDDITSFKRPVLSYEQYEVMIGEKRFEDVYPSCRRL